MTDVTDANDGARRLLRWLDDRLSPLQRASLFVERHQLHPADYYSPEITDLVVACCKLQSVQGMHAARAIIDRLRIETRRQSYRRDEEDDGNDWRSQVVVSARIWQRYIYGWACLAKQRSEVAQQQMKDALEVVESDALRERARHAGGIQSDIQEDSSFDEWLPQSGGEPTTDLYNTVIQGYVNASSQSNDAPIQAYKLLQRMSQLHKENGWFSKPNTRTFTLVMSAFAESGHNGYGGRAVGVLRRMKEMQRREMLAYERKFGVPYDLNHPDRNKIRVVTADTEAHTVALQAVLRSKQDDPNLAANLLRDMQELGMAAKLDPILLSGVITAYRKRVETSDKDEDRRRLVEEAERLLENINFADTSEKQVVHYNAVLDLWARSRLTDAPENAVRLLYQMVNAGLHPDSASLNCCLNAWRLGAKRRKDAVPRALELLSMVENQDENLVQNSSNLMPDIRSYALAIQVLAQDRRDVDRFEKSREILDRCIERVLSGACAASGNLASPYTAVLAVCGTGPSYAKAEQLIPEETFSDSEGKNEAYEIASRTFEELQTDRRGLGASPDHHTYSAYIRCLHRFCAPGSTELRTRVRNVFEQASENGQVSRLVFAALKRIESWRRIVEVEDSVRESKDLPQFYRRNVEKEWI